MYNIFDELDQIELSKAEEFMTEHNLSREDLINLQLPFIMILNLSKDEILDRLGKNKPKKLVKVKKEKISKKEKSSITKDSELNVCAEKKEQNFNNILTDVDFNNIKILTDMSMMEAYNTYNDSKNSVLIPVYEVTLPVSGYNAKMRGLKLDEIDFIRNSIFSDEKSFRDVMENVVFNCITDTGIKNFSKEMFLKGTAFSDFDCLLFGIMRNTYGALSGLSFRCPHCEQEFEQKIQTEDLVFTNNEDISTIIYDLSVSDKTEYFENSVLKTMTKRFAFKRNGLVVDLKFPNLIKDRIIEHQFSKILTPEKRTTRRYYVLSFIDKLYIPIVKNNELQGFYPIDSMQEIYKKLEDVSADDMEECFEFIQEFLDRYRINFKTPPLTCSHCHNKIDQSPFNISDNFFQKVIGR